VIAIEWAERLPPGICRLGLVVEIDFTEGCEDERRVRISASGPRGAEILRQFGIGTDAGACA
jgi:hypothetical protein